MSADFKMTFNPDGTESKTSLNEAMKQDAPATALAPKQQGKMRVIVSEDGTTTVEQNRPTQYRAEPVKQQGVTVRSNNGPITLAQATGSDIVSIPALGGETSVAVALSMGYLAPRAGGGFELTALSQPVQQQQQQ